MVTFSASNYTIILPLLSCFIFALISAFVILAQCGGSKGKKQVGQQAAPRQPQKPGQQRPGPAPLGQPKPGTAAQKGKPTAKPAWTAKEKTKTASTAKKLGGKKDKKATIPTTGKKTADPKFGAIDSDLMSYEAANLQLRRPKIPDPAFPKGTKAPVKSEKAQPNEAKQQIKPGTGNTPDYDTLNFIKAQDIFGKPKGEADVGAGHKEAAPPQSKDEDKEEDNNEEAGVQAGMADTGDYETLAQLDTEDIFKKK